MKSKIIKFFVIVLILFTFITRWMGATQGLPYLYHWDEVITSSGAINVVKNGNIRPYALENCYGGFLRYTCVVIDAVYCEYLLLTGKIESKEDIQTNYGGEFRRLSHPNFYLINRIWSIILSICCIWFSYLIVRFLFPTQYLPAVAPALILSVNGYHYEEARFMLPNVPMAGVAMFVVLFSLRYLENKKIKNLIWALVGGGVAAATKLSGAMILMVPFIAFLSNIMHYKDVPTMKKVLWLAFLGIIPFAVFLFWNPSIFVDFTEWFHWNKWQFDDYNNPNSTQFKKTPGMEHFLYQCENVLSEIKTPVAIMCGIGAITLFFNLRMDNDKFVNKIQLAVFAVLVGFPVFYVFYFVNKHTAFHRNFMIIYPFLAIWLSAFFNSVLVLLGYIFKKNKANMAVSQILVAIAILSLGIFYYPKFKEISSVSKKYYTSPDTRTQSIDYLNNLIKTQYNDKAIVAFASDIQFSEADLKNLKYPYRLFDHKNIQQASTESTLLVTSNYKNYSPTSLVKGDSLNMLTKSLQIIGEIKGDSMFCDSDVVMRLMPHMNPTVKVIKGVSFEKSVQVPEYEQKIDLIFPSNERKNITRNILLKPGRYILQVNTFGSKANGMTAHFKVFVNNKMVKDFYTEEKESPQKIAFEVDKEAKYIISLEMDNDLYDEVKKLDINGFVRYVAVYKNPIN